MDPIEKMDKKSSNMTTLGELINYYYEKFSEIYDDSPELRDLAVRTVIEDIVSRSQSR